MSTTAEQSQADHLEQINLPGSAFHYSYARLPAEQLTQINALFALHQQLSSVATETSDKNVAYTKLHWWSEEIERLKNQQARHPVTRQLSNQRIANQHPELLEQLLGAAKMDFDYDSYPNYLTLCQYFDAGMGSLMTGISYILGEVKSEFGLHLGRAIAQTQRLQRIATDLHSGRLYTPINDLKKFALDAESFRAQSHPVKNQELIDFTIARCQSEFTTAFNSLDQKNASSQQANLAYARIHLALLKKIQSNGLKCMQYRLELSPLRKMFIARLTNPDKVINQDKHE